MGPPIHPAWDCILPVVPQDSSIRPRCCAYIAKRLKHLHPQIRTDLVSHRDIVLISLSPLFGDKFLMGVYNDSGGSMLAVLKEALSRLLDLAYVGGDFNCPSHL